MGRDGNKGKVWQILAEFSSHQLSTIHHQLSTINYPPSTIHHQLLLPSRSELALEAFDLVHQLENQPQAGEVGFVGVPQMFDPAQGSDRFFVELTGFTGGTDQTFFLVMKNRFGGNSGNLGHDLQLVGGIGIRLVEWRVGVHQREGFRGLNEEVDRSFSQSAFSSALTLVGR